MDKNKNLSDIQFIYFLGTTEQQYVIFRIFVLDVPPPYIYSYVFIMSVSKDDIINFMVEDDSLSLHEFQRLLPYINQISNT